MAGHKGRQGVNEPLAALLAAGATYQDAAQTVGINECTARARMRNPKFAARVTEIRSMMISRAAGKLSDVMTAATAKLAELLDHADPNVAARSANYLLCHAVSVVKLSDLDARLRALEIAAVTPNPLEAHP